MFDFLIGKFTLVSVFVRGICKHKTGWVRRTKSVKNLLRMQESILWKQETFLREQETFMRKQETFLRMQETFLCKQETFLRMQETFLWMQETKKIKGSSAAGYRKTFFGG